jgi:hypothetical protein
VAQTSSLLYRGLPTRFPLPADAPPETGAPVGDRLFNAAIRKEVRKPKAD